MPRRRSALFDTSHDVVALVTQPPRMGARQSRGRGESRGRGGRAAKDADPRSRRCEHRRGRRTGWPNWPPIYSWWPIMGRFCRPRRWLWPRGAINLHGSLLPKYGPRDQLGHLPWRAGNRRQHDSHDAARRRRTGPGAARMPIDPDENAIELETRLAELGAPLVLQTIAAIESGSAAALPQDLALATKARRLRKTDGAIDWSRPALRSSRVRTATLAAGLHRLAAHRGRADAVDRRPRRYP